MPRALLPPQTLTQRGGGAGPGPVTEGVFLARGSRCFGSSPPRRRTPRHRSLRGGANVGHEG